MTLAILRTVPGQTIPRPFCRATDAVEAAELLSGQIAVLSGLSLNRDAYRRLAEEARANPASVITVGAIDTEHPIRSINGVTFYAFTE